MQAGKKNTAFLQLRPRCRIWLDNGQESVFGDGRMILLQAIEECGSINQAAAKLNMSYRAAWGKIKVMEERLGFKVIHKYVGGAASGSELTEEAKRLMAAYSGLTAETARAMEIAFQKHFSAFLAACKGEGHKK
ncbi:MAG TPA: LysR family transcriptional regulator [Firmicutes bacterium]|nr:LysR family transcriptional regulator [Bacillota bacterium]